MPAINITKLSESFIWGIWKIEENAKELFGMLGKESAEELHNLSSIKAPHTQLESLGARVMLKTLLREIDEKYTGIWKDKHRKPHLLNSPMHISISHCFPYATAIIDKNKQVGIDIEQEQEKLTKVKSKYLNKDEISFVGNRLDLLCKYWSAKEAVYKANGMKTVSLRDHIMVSFPSFGKAVLEYRGTKKYNLSEYSLGKHHVVFTI